MGHKVEAGPERIRHHVPRPYPDNMITDQIRSTVYLMDPMRAARNLGRFKPLSVLRPARPPEKRVVNTMPYPRTPRRVCPGRRRLAGTW
jgi:hypothetical protein